MLCFQLKKKRGLIFLTKFEFYKQALPKTFIEIGAAYCYSTSL
jgi:hypothetical protein